MSKQGVVEGDRQAKAIREHVNMADWKSCFFFFPERFQGNPAHFLTRQATQERGTRFRVLVTRCSWEGCDRRSFDSTPIICP